LQVLLQDKYNIGVFIVSVINVTCIWNF